MFLYCLGPERWAALGMSRGYLIVSDHLRQISVCTYTITAISMLYCVQMVGCVYAHI